MFVICCQCNAFVPFQVRREQLLFTWVRRWRAGRRRSCRQRAQNNLNCSFSRHKPEVLALCSWVLPICVFYFSLLASSRWMISHDVVPFCAKQYRSSLAHSSADTCWHLSPSKSEHLLDNKEIPHITHILVSLVWVVKMIQCHWLVASEWEIHQQSGGHLFRSLSKCLRCWFSNGRGKGGAFGYQRSMMCVCVCVCRGYPRVGKLCTTNFIPRRKLQSRVPKDKRTSYVYLFQTSF